ncbi:bifunctional diguanylate cyclase/phosphodiesterase [Sphingorhabdus soli]|uniref:Bifunctional diguanylate cyclase/phosphodiesterase n=1 Tax=Flavisphingopyxis soli TaxID=2601267 RepID=A0A5C6U627_9SPHN|nr:bifunctional diguanylate cyclase/phosphodiesterase [Sphingorhabdus soli]
MKHLLPDPEAGYSAREESYSDRLLDALPIAAAVVELHADGHFDVVSPNDHFRDLDLQTTGTQHFAELTTLLKMFASGDVPTAQFTWRGGGDVAGRDYDVTAARLPRGEKDLDLVVLSLLDRTNQVRTERNLRREMVSDALTGLPNRSGFEDAVDKMLKRPAMQKQEFAILAIDLARFSRINEAIGPLAGDELLITVARRLQSNLRAGDFLARTGGDEFSIFAKVANGRVDVREIARRVRGCFDNPCRLSELQISIDCAIGCAIQRNGDVDVDNVMRHAQIAMKRAKQTDRTEIYEPQVGTVTKDRFSLETQLREAIENDELTLAFQPLVELKTGRVAGFEALARWDHKDGAIAPVDFIPIAEDSGLIVPLGRWAIETAAKTLAEWDRKLGHEIPVYVGVNVSAIQLARDDVAEVVRRALASSGIAGDRLMLELTESAIIGDPDRAMAVLAELKSLKARVAMDDFGTGYSNLAYLQRLPIDVLKIDQSFVSGLTDDQDQAAILRTIQGLADSLDMETTAEGIECKEIARALSLLGCTYGQGFYYSKPISADKAFTYWKLSSSN